MKNSLQTLTRIQKFQIDEQRKILNEYLSREEKILKDLKRMFLEYEQEKDFASHQGYVGDFGTYTKRWKQYKDALEQALEDVRQKIAEVRDIISDMFKEQKTYEIIDRNRKEREEKEEELKNQKTLDEIGTNAYIKRNKKQDN